MRGKKAKAVRRAVVRLFEQDQARFPIGYQRKGGTLFNVRRVMYRRIKRLTNVESMTLKQIGGLFT
jgi:hypothetical protein